MTFHVWPCFQPGCANAEKTKEAIIIHERTHGYIAPKQISYTAREMYPDE